MSMVVTYNAIGIYMRIYCRELILITVSILVGFGITLLLMWYGIV